MKDLNEEQLRNVTGGADVNKKFAEECSKNDSRVEKCMIEKGMSSLKIEAECIEHCKSGLLGERR